MMYGLGVLPARDNIVMALFIQRLSTHTLCDFADVCGDISFFPVTVRKVEQHQERISFWSISVSRHDNIFYLQHFLAYQH